MAPPSKVVKNSEDNSNNITFRITRDSDSDAGFGYTMLRSTIDGELFSGLFIAEIDEGGPANIAGITQQYLYHAIVGIDNVFNFDFTIAGTVTLLQMLSETIEPNRSFSITLRR